MLYELFADGAAQVRSLVHTYAHLVRKPFASGSQTMWHAHVYEALHSPLTTSPQQKITKFSRNISKIISNVPENFSTNFQKFSTKCP